MTSQGLPVPPGFTSITDASKKVGKNETVPSEAMQQSKESICDQEKRTGKSFGGDTPLLVSVRSGAPVSMPGMMDTILNLGLNDETVQAIIRQTNNPRFAYDSYRRFVQMYGDVVLGLKPVDKHDEDPFEVILDKKKHKHGFRLDTELTANHLKELVEEFKAAIREKTGHDFPSDPMDQLWGAVGAVIWVMDE